MVSVYIITYNHEKLIAQVIESILRQKKILCEVIGDDHSTNNTIKIRNEYLVKNLSIITSNLQRKNVGAVTNFTTSFNLCKGHYVVFLEGDYFRTDDKNCKSNLIYSLRKYFLEIMPENLNFCLFFEES